MPGLVGFVNKVLNRNKSYKVLETMRELITHKQFYVENDIFQDGSVYATRSHLNILQKTEQPFISEEIHVWMDGEFYSQELLIEKSETMGDPEILAQLYQKDTNLNFLKKINGIFSAVIYDKKYQQVHLITDRYGLQYLYWGIIDNNLIWSSEVKAFLGYPNFTPKINHESVQDFFSEGYLKDNKTWFDGVELLPSGTVLTWDIKTSKHHIQQYWSWSDIKPFIGKVNEKDIVDELGYLFSQAIERQTKQSEKIGITLSGGLDSRAILAAIPKNNRSIPTLTFGKVDCDDAQIAKEVANLKGASFQFYELNHHNWLTPRLKGIWYSDGQLDLTHMHGIEAFEDIREKFQINMSGYLGDALLGGSYLNNTAGSSFKKYQNRGRRFIAMGTRLMETSIHVRKPFFDNQLMEFTISIPESMRKKSYIYNKMLLHKYPEYFQSIPWQNTGYAIGSSTYKKFTIRFLNSFKRQYRNRLSIMTGVEYNNPNRYTDYPRWIRQEPAISFFKEVLKSSLSLYPEFIDKTKVLSELEQHISGSDFSDNLCRYLTFEIWLQQVFSARYRGGLND